MVPDDVLRAKADLVVRATTMVVNLERFIAVIESIDSKPVVPSLVENLDRADQLLDEIDRHIQILLTIFEAKADDMADDAESDP